LLRIESRRKPIVTEFVIEFALVRVSQNLIGERDYLKLFLGALNSRLEIRVVASCQLTVRLAYLLPARVARYTQDLIVIPIPPWNFHSIVPTTS
jgi:hypothetical protein